jgi:hypothetical protein
MNLENLPTELELQNEYQETCTQFIDILKMFDYIHPVTLDKIRDYILKPTSAEETAVILYRYNKNLIECCKNKKCSYLFFNEITIFGTLLPMSCFMKESKKTKKNIVKHLSNILTKSLPLVTEKKLLEDELKDIPPELSKLIKNISESVGQEDLSKLDPMKLLFDTTPESANILNTIKDKFKDVDHTKILQETMGLMQNPEFLKAMTSSFSNAPFLNDLFSNTFSGSTSSK